MPTTATTPRATPDASKMGGARRTGSPPAVTIVAAWISADTGVGPSMASGSHTWSGSWADFPTAPANSSSAMAVAVPEASPPAAPNTSSNRTDPVVENARKIPISMAVSPIRVTMKAFFPASAAARRSNQNAISRYEHRPTPSHPTYSRTSTDTTNDAPTSSDASPPAMRRRGLPANSRATAPARGNAGTSQMRSVTLPSPMRCAAPRRPGGSRPERVCEGRRGPGRQQAPRAEPRSPMSPSEQVDVVHVGGYPASEDGHDDRESNHNFSGRNHHREECEHLAVDLAELAGEGDQRQVDRVQLELDRHEDHQRVAADQHTDRADREQQRRHHEEERDRGPHGTRSGSRPAGASSARSGRPRAFRRASTMAATAAMISRIEVSSNGKT